MSFLCNTEVSMLFFKQQNIIINRVFLGVITFILIVIGYFNLTPLAQYLNQSFNQVSSYHMIIEPLISWLVQHYFFTSVVSVLVILGILFIQTLIGRHNRDNYYRYSALCLIIINLPMVLYWGVINEYHAYLLLGAILALLLIKIYFIWKISKYRSES